MAEEVRNIRQLFYVAQYFTPEPYLKNIDFVKELQWKGWEVTVITGNPQYPRGAIYGGYKNRLFSEEFIDGIRIIRTYTYADHSKSLIRRSLNYLVFGFFAALAILKFGQKRSSYYILQSSPLVLFCAFAIRIFKPRSQIVLDIQDLYPENIRVSGFIKSHWIIRLLEKLLQQFYYPLFDKFVVVSQGFKEILVAYGISPSRIQVVYNWSMTEGKSIVGEPIQFEQDYINLVYAGNIGIHQGLSKLVEGIKAVICKHSNVYFHFVGGGIDETELKKSLQSFSQVKFHGRVSPEVARKFMSAADILFMHLIKDEVYKKIIPSKLQAYIEAGKPILAGVEGEASRIIIDNELGLIFEPENSESLTDAFKGVENVFKLIERRDVILTKSRIVYEREFSRVQGVAKINKILENVD